MKEIAGVSKVRYRQLVVNKLMKIFFFYRQKSKISVPSKPMRNPIDPVFDPM